MSTTHYRFEKVQLGGSKRLACPHCGTKVRRQRTFWQTVNPFNKNAAGGQKTRQEILAELRAEIAAWKQQPERCTPCADAAWEARAER